MAEFNVKISIQISLAPYGSLWHNRLSFSPASLLDMFWIFANNEIYSCLHLFQFEILLLQGLLTVGPVTNEMDVYPDTKIQLHVRGGSILPMQEPARNTVHRYTGLLSYHFIYYMTLSGYFKMKISSRLAGENESRFTVV
jgi:hypothetical protein